MKYTFLWERLWKIQQYGGKIEWEKAVDQKSGEPDFDLCLPTK